MTLFPELNENTGFYVLYYKNSLYDHFSHVLPSYTTCWPLLWAPESTGTLQTQVQMNKYNNPFATMFLRTKDCCTYSLLRVQQDALTHNKDKYRYHSLRNFTVKCHRVKPVSIHLY
jgi:hypothetical protein